jgi:hypothetical protein
MSSILPVRTRVVPRCRELRRRAGVAGPEGLESHRAEAGLLAAPDYSGWLLCARENLDESIAHTIAGIVADYGSELNRAMLAGGGRVTFESPQPPVHPKAAVDTSPVPLHPGAERLYRKRGLL